MEMYQAHALEGASGVELTIALYDGIIRFMHHAIDAVLRNDTAGRRGAVKRAMDIVVHLQATMDRNVGGEPAEALSEFYVAMFALMLQGSQANSRKKFEQVIANVRNVREAWKQVAVGSNSNRAATWQGEDKPVAGAGMQWALGGEEHSGASWNA